MTRHLLALFVMLDLILVGHASANLQGACTVAKIVNNGATTVVTVDVDTNAVAQQVRASAQAPLQRYNATVGTPTFALRNPATLGVDVPVSIPGVTGTLHARIDVAVSNATANVDVVLESVTLPTITVNIGPLRQTVPGRTIPLNTTVHREQLTLPSFVGTLQSMQLVAVSPTAITATITTAAPPAPVPPATP